MDAHAFLLPRRRTRVLLPRRRLVGQVLRTVCTILPIHAIAAATAAAVAVAVAAVAAVAAAAPAAVAAIAICTAAAAAAVLLLLLLLLWSPPPSPACVMLHAMLHAMLYAKAFPALGSSGSFVSCRRTLARVTCGILWVCSLGSSVSALTCTAKSVMVDLTRESSSHA